MREGAVPHPPAALGMPLLPVVRNALAAAPGGVALRLAPAGPLTGPPHRRRAAKALLQDAALSGGGQVFETAAGDLLLLAAAAPAAARAAAVLARLAAEAPPETFTLPADNALLLAWAEHARLPPPAHQGPFAQAPGLAGLDALLEAVPIGRLLRRWAVLRHAPGRPPAVAARHVAVSRTALAMALGPLAPDPDLLRHAADRIAARLPGSLPAPDQDGAAGGPLLLPLPLLGQPGPAPRPGLVGVLPLAAAADPAALAERRVALAAAGWGLAIGGLDAAALRVVAPAALPADLLLLRWSPALAERAIAAMLRTGSPPADRLVLTGCDGPEALDWGRGQGIVQFAGPHVAALLAASRMVACPAASGCSVTQCAGRAAAIEASGRGGCRNAGLLAALLPGSAA